MTDLEQLVRESLHGAPTPVPRTTDPLPAVERRVRRTRRLLGAGAAVAVAAVTVAVVVPLTATSGAGSPRLHVQPLHAPRSPAVGTPPVSPAGVDRWSSSGSVTVAAGDGSLWQLRRAGGSSYVDRVDPRTHATVTEWRVQEPADAVAMGGGVVWVRGGTSTPGLVQAIDTTRTGANAVALTLPGQDVSALVPLAGRTALATVGDAVLQLRADASAVTQVARVAVTSPRGIVVTESGAVWTRSGGQWLRIGLDRGGLMGRVIDRVPWTGPILGAAGGDGVWTTLGPQVLVDLTPALLHQGQSLAQGTPLLLPGPVQVVAGTVTGGAYVLASRGPAAAAPSSLYFLGPQALSRGQGAGPRTPSVPASPTSVVVNPAGGADYSEADGTASHWQP